LELEKFVVTPKGEKTVVMTIRIDETIQQRLDELAQASNRSRNELINLALGYALDNLEFTEQGKKA
jgi:predicted transcriptional regulator